MLLFLCKFPIACQKKLTDYIEKVFDCNTARLTAKATVTSNCKSNCHQKLQKLILLQSCRPQKQMISLGGRQIAHCFVVPIVFSLLDMDILNGLYLAVHCASNSHLQCVRNKNLVVDFYWYISYPIIPLIYNLLIYYLL